MVKKLLAGIMSLGLLCSPCYAAGGSMGVMRITSQSDDSRTDVNFINCENFIREYGLNSLKKYFAKEVNEFIKSKKAGTFAVIRCTLDIVQGLYKELRISLPPEAFSRLVGDIEQVEHSSGYITGFIEVYRENDDSEEVFIKFVECPNARSGMAVPKMCL